ncbi:MAG TPA: hypothetical protein VNK82_02895 [Terriglobales bacterium]|nr:hypothetical protein [Terriglobales bacterium]
MNVALAELLETRGLVSVPETIRKSVKGKRLPDITVAELMGIRLVVEGRFDSPAAKVSLLKDAKQRVEDGISPVCLAVLYPKELRSTKTFSELKVRLGQSRMQVRVVSEAGDGDAWSDGSVDDIAESLRRAYELIVSDDVVVKCVEDLERAIDGSSDAFVHTKAMPQRFRATLGIPAQTRGRTEDEAEDEE